MAYIDGTSLVVRKRVAGTGTNLETLIAQDQLLQAQVQLASQEFEYKVAYLTLIRVVGSLEIKTAS